MTVTTPEVFLALLEKSRLLAPAQLAQAREAARGSTDPIAIAKGLARSELITRWQAGQLLAGRSSFYLGKYRLLQLLGHSSMGKVFLGQHVTMNRRVALKILSPDIIEGSASLDRFLAEARAIASLDHPNIVQVYSVDNDHDRYYLVMEYVEGLDLERLVGHQGPLDCQRAAAFIRQAADGLDHAHRRNMVHGDIKPSTLMVNREGSVKILGMGLARLAPGGVAPEGGQEGPLDASADYLAPEQAGGAKAADCRADIYALGCTFYFLLTGHAPSAERHAMGEAPTIDAERSDVPAELLAICRKMMAHQPENRYASAAEVSRALAAWNQPKRAVRLPVARPLPEEAEADVLEFQLAAEGPNADAPVVKSVAPWRVGRAALIASLTIVVALAAWMLVRAVWR